MNRTEQTCDCQETITTIYLLKIPFSLNDYSLVNTDISSKNFMKGIFWSSTLISKHIPA